MTAKKNKLIAVAAACLMLAGLFDFAAAQPFTLHEKKILELQDMRSTGENNELIKFLNSGETAHEYRSAFALANIGDSSVIPVLGERLLHLSDSYVPHISSFALGEIGFHKGSEYLLKAIRENLDKKDKLTHELVCELLNDLGRTGDENDLNEMLKLSTNDDIINSYIALAIARFGLRKVKNENSFLRLAGLIEQSSAQDVRKYSAYAFNRIGDKQLLQPYNTELITLSESADPFTRMWAFSALGKIQDTASVPYLLKSLAEEKDWRVKVNIINALGNYKIDNTSSLLSDVAAALLEESVNGQNTHTSIVSLQALGKLFAGADSRDMTVSGIRQQLQFILTPGKAVDWQVKAEAVRTYAKIFRDEAADELLSLFSQTDNYDIKAAVVGSMGFMENAMIYKQLRDSISADVMRYNAVNPNKDGSMIGSPDLAKIYKAFVEALAELDNRLDEENRNTIRLIFSEFASSKNAPIVDISLANLQDSMYLKYRTETCQIMMFDYESFKYPQDKDVTIMYIEAWGKMGCSSAVEILTKNLKHNDYDIAKASAGALKSITGKDYEKEINAPKLRHDFDWQFIDNLGTKKTARLRTSRGEIVIELYPHIAPFTVQNFVKLGESGYYNNTIFHRVVPNFVIQGGDPSGTGYGGPGYSIRSEFSPLPFEEYTVGMASSGKDTEGSQFFITHSPQPHLDGKYTLFGKVISGFEVVDMIQMGDVIEGISFSSE